jgi:hypothetical protein
VPFGDATVEETNDTVLVDAVTLDRHEAAVLLIALLEVVAKRIEWPPRLVLRNDVKVHELVHLSPLDVAMPIHPSTVPHSVFITPLFCVTLIGVVGVVCVVGVVGVISFVLGGGGLRGSGLGGSGCIAL